MVLQAVSTCPTVLASQTFNYRADASLEGCNEVEKGQLRIWFRKLADQSIFLRRQDQVCGIVKPFANEPGAKNVVTLSVRDLIELREMWFLNFHRRERFRMFFEKHQISDPWLAGSLKGSLSKRRVEVRGVPQRFFNAIVEVVRKRWTDVRFELNRRDKNPVYDYHEVPVLGRSEITWKRRLFRVQKGTGEPFLLNKVGEKFDKAVELFSSRDHGSIPGVFASGSGTLIFALPGSCFPKMPDCLCESIL